MYRIRESDRWPAHYQIGMWAWLLHRISGVVILLYGIAHLVVIFYSRFEEGAGFDRLMENFQKPWVLALELLLLGVILFHFLNGFRIVLFDLGIGIRRQKALFWGLMAVGVALFVVALVFTLPYLRGEALT